MATVKKQKVATKSNKIKKDNSNNKNRAFKENPSHKEFWNKHP
jgi:hypothetical protein